RYPSRNTATRLPGGGPARLHVEVWSRRDGDRGLVLGPEAPDRSGCRAVRALRHGLPVEGRGLRQRPHLPRARRGVPDQLRLAGSRVGPEVHVVGDRGSVALTLAATPGQVRVLADVLLSVGGG